MEEDKIKSPQASQRYRRTRANLEQDIITAAEQLIGEKGFSRLKLTELCAYFITVMRTSTILLKSLSETMTTG